MGKKNWEDTLLWHELGQYHQGFLSGLDVHHVGSWLGLFFALGLLAWLFVTMGFKVLGPCA
jgi:hypothetical protein